jgi:hypothetical protein
MGPALLDGRAGVSGRGRLGRECWVAVRGLVASRAYSRHVPMAGLGRPRGRQHAAHGAAPGSPGGVAASRGCPPRAPRQPAGGRVGRERCPDTARRGRRPPPRRSLPAATDPRRTDRRAAMAAWAWRAARARRRRRLEGSASLHRAGMVLARLEQLTPTLTLTLTLPVTLPVTVTVPVTRNPHPSTTPTPNPSPSPNPNPSPSPSPSPKP